MHDKDKSRRIYKATLNVKNKTVNYGHNLDNLLNGGEHIEGIGNTSENIVYVVRNAVCIFLNFLSHCALLLKGKGY